MSRQPLSSARERTLPARRAGRLFHGRRNGTPERCNATAQPARPRHPPSQSAATNSARIRLWVGEGDRWATSAQRNSPPTKNHHDVGKTSARASAPCQKSAQTLARPVLQGGPEHVRIKEPPQHLRQPGLRPPLLTSAFAPTSNRPEQSRKPPSCLVAVPSPIMRRARSASAALPGNINDRLSGKHPRVHRSLTVPTKRMAANSLTVSGRSLRQRPPYTSSHPAGSAVGVGAVGLRS